jgi:hypothetical protein
MLNYADILARSAFFAGKAAFLASFLPIRQAVTIFVVFNEKANPL